MAILSEIFIQIGYFFLGAMQENNSGCFFLNTVYATVRTDTTTNIPHNKITQKKQSIRPRPYHKLLVQIMHLCKRRGSFIGGSSCANRRCTLTQTVSTLVTQCYLPPDRGDRPAFTPTGQVGTRFIDPVRMKG